MTGPVRVMVVEDTDHVRRMLTSMLELDGFEIVAEVASGQLAVDGVAAADPDVIVIDYKMPAMDGLSVARMVREVRPQQVIILYTAYVDGALEEEAAAAGIALCVDKMEGLASLEREITRLVGSRPA
jgi:two-component system response regulator YesN